MADSSLSTARRMQMKSKTNSSMRQSPSRLPTNWWLFSNTTSWLLGGGKKPFFVYFFLDVLLYFVLFFFIFLLVMTMEKVKTKKKKKIKGREREQRTTPSTKNRGVPTKVPSHQSRSRYRISISTNQPIDLTINRRLVFWFCSGLALDPVRTKAFSSFFTHKSLMDDRIPKTSLFSGLVLVPVLLLDQNRTNSCKKQQFCSSVCCLLFLGEGEKKREFHQSWKIQML